MRRLVYVSVLHAESMRARVRLVAAKERFVDALRASPVASTVVRPTGFFSDMDAFLQMAGRGRAFLVGDGRSYINPISGPDVARVVLEAALDGVTERTVGGPDVFSYEEIVRLAFYVAGRRPRIVHIPSRVAAAAVAAARVSTPVSVTGPAEFLLAALTQNMVAPPTGYDHLEDYFRAQLDGRE